MKTLYIIGNGFDVHHRLKTRYQHFAYFLQDNHSDLYDLLIENYGLTDLDRDNEDDLYDALWSEFETQLAEFDFQTIFDNHAHLAANPASDDFRDRDWYSYEIAMEEVVNDLTTHLFKAFKEFILAVEFPADIAGLKLNLDTGSSFLCFNYTDTLEHYYGVPESNIVYIHNKAKTPKATLVLGHGISPDSFIEPEPQPPAGASDEELYEWPQQQSDNYELSSDRAKTEILSYFSKSHKNTVEVLVEHKAFFESLENIEHIIVLGHSLAPVDQPYIAAILKTNDFKAEWQISYYKDEDIDSHKYALTSLGLPESRITSFKMSNILL